MVKVFTFQDGNNFYKYGPKDKKCRFKLEFLLCVIIKTVLRRRLLVFKGGQIKMATKFTLVAAQNSRNFILLEEQKIFSDF
jgi:hypothetical protein